MVRASRVLKRQLMVALALLRSVTRASTSLLKCRRAGFRQRDSTLNSISAIAPYLMRGSANSRAWGCSWHSSRLAMGFLSRESLVQRCGDGCSQDDPYGFGMLCRLIHQPAHPAGKSCIVRRSVTATCRHPPTAHRPRRGRVLPAVFVGRQSRPGRDAAAGSRPNWVDVSSKQTTGRWGS